MFIVTYAGKFYGPFKTANEAANFATGNSAKFVGPWQIVVLFSPKDAADE